MPRRPTFGQRLRNAVKALSGYTPYGGSYGGVRYGPGFTSNSLLQPGAREDYTREVGDISHNSILSIGLNWLADQAAQARLQVCKEGADDGDDETIDDHELVEMWQRPNAAYSGDELLGAVLKDFTAYGDALVIKARGMGGAGNPVDLWYEPWANVIPYREKDSPNLVDYYWITRPEGRRQVFPEDVIRFRDGIDPYNPMYGLSRPKRQLRSIISVNRAETYTGAILKWGTLDGVWVPESDQDVDAKEALELQSRMERSATGESSGRIPVMHMPGHFEKIGSGPEELKLDVILERPIAIICAALGLSPMALGLPDSSRTYDNYDTALQAAWTMSLMPKLKKIASALYHQLLPDFGDTEGLCVKFDYTGIKALSEDETEKVNRAVLMVGGPIATENEGRRYIGLEPIEGGDESPTQKADRQMQQATDLAMKQDAANQDNDGDANEDDPNDPENPASDKDKAK